jgi:hypothetical protein
VRFSVAFVSLALVVACKGKPRHEDPGPSAAKGSGSGSGSATESGSGSAIPSGPRPDIDLPRGTGLPPAKTTAALTKPQLEKLSEIKVPRFVLQVKMLTNVLCLVRQTTDDHPKIAVTIAIAPCPGHECRPADLATWKADPTPAKKGLDPALEARPDTKFELGEDDLNGQKMISSYQLGYWFESEAAGKWTDMYCLYFNDTINRIHVCAEYKDDPTNDLESMVKLVPKQDLVNVAKAFMDIYTQAWAAP